MIRPRTKKAVDPKRTGGLEPLWDLLPSAGIIQQVRGVIPNFSLGISQPVQLPQQIYRYYSTPFARKVKRRRVSCKTFHMNANSSFRASIARPGIQSRHRRDSSNSRFPLSREWRNRDFCKRLRRITEFRSQNSKKPKRLCFILLDSDFWIQFLNGQRLFNLLPDDFIRFQTSPSFQGGSGFCTPELS